jgi:hypothetical protein
MTTQPAHASIFIRFWSCQAVGLDLQSCCYTNVAFRKCFINHLIEIGRLAYVLPSSPPISMTNVTTVSWLERGANNAKVASSTLVVTKIFFLPLFLLGMLCLEILPFVRGLISFYACILFA